MNQNRSPYQPANVYQLLRQREATEREMIKGSSRSRSGPYDLSSNSNLERKKLITGRI